MINNNDDNIFFENNNFCMKTKRSISPMFNSFLSKCLCSDIKNRPDWDDLKKDKFMKNESDNKDENEKEFLLNENQFDIILNYYLKKYISLYEYYEKLDINNLDNISQNEDFLILTLYEMKIIKEILSDEKNFSKDSNEITILILPKIIHDQYELTSKLELNSENSFNMKLINDSLCREKKTNLINIIKKNIKIVIDIIKNINKKTNSNKFSIEKNEISNDFLKNFINNFKHYELQNLFLSFILKFNEDYKNNENVDYILSFNNLNYSKYIGEFLLFFKESIREKKERANDKKYDSKEKLLKDINNIFKCEKDNYIIISPLYDKLLKIMLDSSNDKLIINNKSSLSQLIHFYPFLLKMINFVNFKRS